MTVLSQAQYCDETMEAVIEAWIEIEAGYTIDWCPATFTDMGGTVGKPEMVYCINTDRLNFTTLFYDTFKDNRAY